MAGTIKVGFEVDTSTAKQQGQKAGAEFGKGVSSGLATSTEGAFSKELQDRIQKAGASIGKLAAAKRFGPGQTGMENFFKYLGPKPPALKDIKQPADGLSKILLKFAGELFLAHKALQLIRFELSYLKNVFESSHKLYGNALSGGMSLGFTANRQMTADTLGVNEKDVFRFKQSAMIMSQLSGATSEIAKNAPQLAFTVVQFKILQYKLLALGSDIAVKLAPALNDLAFSLQVITEIAMKFGKYMEGFAGGVLSEIFGNPQILKYLLAVYSSVKGGGGSLGQPQTFMRQMQAGAFEKMGLVVGSGGKMMDYARRTAVAVEKIAKATPSKGNSMPRGYSSVFNPISNMP